VTVIAVMHEAIPPRSAAGASFYDTVMTLADGVATKTPLGVRTPEVKIKKAAADVSPAATPLFPGGSRPA
jgi:putative ATP-binding cassette transporter